MPSNNEGTVLLLPSVGLHEINEKIFGWGAFIQWERSIINPLIALRDDFL